MAKYTKTLGGDSYNRYVLEVDITYTQNVANNTTTFTYKGYVKYSGDLSYGRYWAGGSSAYLKQGSTNWANLSDFSYDFSSTSSKQLFSGTKTVTHSSDGKLSLSFTAYVNLYNQSYPGMNATLTFTVTPPTIPRASTFVSAQSYITEGTNPKIVVSKKHATYTHKLTVRLKSPTTTVVAGPLDFSGTEYTIPLTGNTTYINRIYSNTPNHLKYTLELTLDTYSGSTKIGSATKTINGTNSKAKPALSNAYYKDGKSKIVGKTGSDQIIVQRLSTLNVGVTCAATKHATLKQLKMEAAGLTMTLNLSGSSGSYYRTVGTPTSVISAVKITLTDSRGQTHVINHPITMIAYEYPTLVHASADRRNSYEQDTYFNATLRRSIIKIDGADINGTSVGYRVKPKNSSTWGPWVDFTPLLTSTSGGTATEQVSSVFMDNYPNDEVFDLQFGWSDLIEDVWRTRSGELTKGIALMSFYQDMIKAGVDLYVKDSKVATEAALSALRDAIYDDSGSYRKIIGKGGYISTPSSGIIPESSNSAGLGNVGTSGWPFVNGYFANSVVIKGNAAWHNGTVTSSKAANGYIRFPNGVIIQWGNQYWNASGINYKAITYPIAFPSTCVSISGSFDITSNTAEDDWYAYATTFSNITRTSARVRIRAGDDNKPPATVKGYARWIAIGY